MDYEARNKMNRWAESVKRDNNDNLIDALEKTMKGEVDAPPEKINELIQRIDRNISTQHSKSSKEVREALQGTNLENYITDIHHTDSIMHRNQLTEGELLISIMKYNRVNR